MKVILSTLSLLALAASPLTAEEKEVKTTEAKEGKHLFLLSGQSNMARFKAKLWFTPAISKALGSDNVIVCFKAQGGKPISRWYKDWQSSKGEKDPEAGTIYDELIKSVNAATKDQKIKSVTYIWMQGENDAKSKNGDVYLASLNGLKKQLERDLKRTDIHYVIGRLSDFGLYKKGVKKENPEWEKVRNAQVAFADASDKAVWIDTDDLNGEKHDLHYIKPEGYEKLGERYVEASLKLIGTHKK